MMTFLQARSVSLLAFAPQEIAGSSPVVGATIDKHDIASVGEGMFEEGCFEVVSGALGDAGGSGDAPASAATVALQVQDSANGSSWADVTDPNLAEQGVTFTGASKIARVGFRPVALRRYVRITADPTFTGGTNPTIHVAGVCLLSEPRTV